LYEVYVPCDTIQLFSDPYHAEFKAVGFWYGGSDECSNLRLTIMKRPDGDLKVWPVFPFPKSHRCGEPNPALQRIAARQRLAAVQESVVGRHQ